jgi:hypothetical protein
LAGKSNRVAVFDAGLIFVRKCPGNILNLNKKAYEKDFFHPSGRIPDAARHPGFRPDVR